jgi:hypothetical protein
MGRPAGWEGDPVHQQIRTSPDSVDENLANDLAALAPAVNVEGVGPDYKSPHVRVVVAHAAMDEALGRLGAYGPEARPACTVALPNEPGALNRRLERIRKRFEVQSVLVLASRGDGLTLVSIGLDREPTAEEREHLGCIDEPDGWVGGDFSSEAAS